MLLAGCAQPYVRPAAPETLTPELYADHAVMADGYVLPLTVWRPPRDTRVRAVVLALHGLNDYRKAYAEVGKYLGKRGIITYAYDQRGFGETDGVGVWHGVRRLDEDLHTMVSLLRQVYGKLPLYVMSESMGGAVLLSSLQPVPPEIDGVILVAPAVWARSTMPFLQRTALWFAAHIFPGETLTGHGLNITPSDNKEMLRAMNKDPLTIKATRVDVLYGVARLMDKAYAAVPLLTLPAFILYGQHDQIIPKQPICDMIEKLPTGEGHRWRMAYYPDGYHMLTRDIHRQVVLRDIATWLINQHEALPSGDEILTQDQPKAPFCRS